ncbi:hypothetical protein B0J11DRAFT_586634 [Dendryphion nanum]|uniref:Uncharacterized protein n=1 Tax=Dendryphion nanum TaxID=256645 RepID=A0A9P9I6Y9_9PLEO|nr:hypothetical protein B0J11DRAFT_586634 [Dendryphion nanum]
MEATSENTTVYELQNLQVTSFTDSQLCEARGRLINLWNKIPLVKDPLRHSPEAKDAFLTFLCALDDYPGIFRSPSCSQMLEGMIPEMRNSIYEYWVRSKGTRQFHYFKKSEITIRDVKEIQDWWTRGNLGNLHFEELANIWHLKAIFTFESHESLMKMKEFRNIIQGYFRDKTKDLDPENTASEASTSFRSVHVRVELPDTSFETSVAENTNLHSVNLLEDLPMRLEKLNELPPESKLCIVFDYSDYKDSDRLKWRIYEMVHSILPVLKKLAASKYKVSVWVSESIIIKEIDESTTVDGFRDLLVDARLKAWEKWYLDSSSE